jgi:hypothetical protein
MRTRLLRISAWSNLALGTVHCLATPVVLGTTNFGKLDGPDLRTFLFMYLGTGVPLAMTGVAQLTLLGGLREGRSDARKLQVLSASYLAVIGIGAVLAMADNPFAWLLFAAAGLTVASCAPDRMSAGGEAARP